MDSLNHDNHADVIEAFFSTSRTSTKEVSRILLTMTITLMLSRLLFRFLGTSMSF